MGIEELTFYDLLYLEKVYLGVYEGNDPKLKNFEVMEMDNHIDDPSIEILHDKVENRYYRIIDYFGNYEEVFPTEVTKTVYLPKELT